MTLRKKIQNLDDLEFDNRFVQELPSDPDTSKTPRQVNSACYSLVQPTKVAQPGLIAYSKELAIELGLSEQICESEDFAQVFAGNRLTEAMQPYAMCYGGHQFGQWAGQLGDGRAINLGEAVTGQNKRLTLQLKGAGLTPYSRTADGLAVVRSSVREFLCSEAMHHLGVPTTRALSLVGTGETVIRDMFYNGNPKAEPGAIVCRVAPSFIRFGNFQILTARREHALLRQLADFTIRTEFPHLGEPAPDVYIAWFSEICRRTAEMIVHWQRVGFVHGVMNTDNMSILGLTIDYGPYGWLEDYDPNWTPNTTDAGGKRYRFGHQPQIAYWNLGQLANALYPLIEQVEPLQQGLSFYTETFEAGWQKMMSEKLGFTLSIPETDDDLITELLLLLQWVETDMTLFFRRLGTIQSHHADLEDATLIAPLLTAYYQPDQLTEDYRSRLTKWLRAYLNRVQLETIPDATRTANMNAVNPKYVLRNYLAQLAIDKAEQGDYSGVQELLDVLRKPYDEQSGYDKYAAKRPDWARHRAGCSMLSCSS